MALRGSISHSLPVIMHDRAARQRQRLQESPSNKKMIEEFAENLPVAREAMQVLYHKQARSGKYHTRTPSWSLLTNNVTRTSDHYIHPRHDAHPRRSSLWRGSHLIIDVHGKPQIIHTHNRNRTSSQAPHTPPQLKSTPVVSDTFVTPPSLDVKMRISTAQDLTKREDRTHGLDNFTASVVPVTQSSHSAASTEHRKWLASCRRLALTDQTPHVETDTRRQLHRQDCKRAFRSARVPTLRQSPAVIAWPKPATEVVRKDQSRCLWWQNARGTTRIDRTSAGSNRFYPWAGFDLDKMKATMCFFTDLSPAHLTARAPSHLLREQTKQREEYEREERERRIREERDRRAGNKVTNKCLDPACFDRPDPYSMNVCPSQFNREVSVKPGVTKSKSDLASSKTSAPLNKPVGKSNKLGSSSRKLEKQMKGAALASKCEVSLKKSYTILPHIGSDFD